jgi:hypothetical protein
MIRVCPTDVCMRNLRKERRNRERMPVLIQVPGAHKRLTSRKRVMCARNIRATKKGAKKLVSSDVAKILEKESSNKIRETCEKTMFTPSNTIIATQTIDHCLAIGCCQIAHMNLAT